jgi:hypothetical protein
MVSSKCSSAGGDVLVAVFPASKCGLYFSLQLEVDRECVSCLRDPHGIVRAVAISLMGLLLSVISCHAISRPVFFLLFIDSQMYLHASLKSSHILISLNLSFKPVVAAVKKSGTRLRSKAQVEFLVDECVRYML